MSEPLTRHAWAGRVVEAVLAAADPARAVARAWPTRLDGVSTVGVIAFGKASAAMAGEACARLGERCLGGVALAPEATVRRVPSVLEALTVDHPLPTSRNVRAGERVRSFVGSLPSEAWLLALVSGGGSAHLTLPMPGVTLEDLREVTDALNRAGATIGELNAVRKHLEQLKGGRLARLAAHAGGVAQVTLSDVLGDDLATIASGPMAPDRTTYREALGVLDRHGIACERVRAHLARGVLGELEETARADEACFQNVEHVIGTNNRDAVDAATRVVRTMGDRVRRSSAPASGEARDVAQTIVRAWRGDGGAVVWGGETTVRVGAFPGRGGRVQEMMLTIAIELERCGGRASALGFATDGVDGPTDACGAVVDDTTCARMREKGIEPGEAMARHESFVALEAAGDLVRTGATGTNVNDVVVLRAGGGG